MYIDTHAHIYGKDYKEDADLVIKESFEQGVKAIILPAVDSSSHDEQQDVYDRNSSICYQAMGLHPTSVNENPNFRDELQEVAKRLEKGGYIAVGEVGMDLYWSKDYVAEQIEALKFQVELSLQYKLPLLIHTRDAFEEIFDVLSNYKGLRGVFHGFSGGAEEYQRAKELGDFKFGIGGVVTFKNSNLKECVKLMNLEDILLETDAPYLTPVPNRGRRNHPKYIPAIAAFIGDLHGVSGEEVGRVTTKTAKELFSI